MVLKRLLFLAVLAAVLSLGAVSDASAGSIADFTPCPRGGSGVLICPVGTTGQNYSIKFRGDEDPICAPGDDKWFARNGSVPPGLTLNTDGTLAGTPTEPGTYSFWIHLELPDYFNPEPPPGQGCSSRDNSEEPVSITIIAGLAKLTIGPESTTPGTRGTPYSLQMTATVPDAKTWTHTGALPPGLTLDASTGLISGTPTAAGSYSFEVKAQMNADTRSDTKALGIVVRDPVTLAATEPFTAARRAVGEVSVPFEAMLTASGGTGTYTWALSTGTLPTGLLFEDGAISGTPSEAGVFPFTVTATDSEGRVANYPGRVVVAEELTVSTLLLRPGRVGKLYAARVRTVGGVRPTTWRILRGPLPRGVRFDRVTGKLLGIPKKAGTYRVTFVASDALEVTAPKTFRILIAPAPKPKKRSR